MLSDGARVVVVMGGLSAEREVSLASGAAVVECLERAGQPVKAFDLAPGVPRPESVRGLLDTVREFRADVVYLALHGPLGEDGTVQGLLDLAGVPYNGSGVLASAVCNDKMIAKQVMIAAKIPTPRFAVSPRGAAPAKSPLPLPVVVKPRALGSSLGVSIVRRDDEFGPACELASTFGQDLLIESFAAGRELQAAVVDGEPLPLIEIKTEGGFYDYAAKYEAGKSKHLVPAPLPKKQYEAAQRLAVSAYRALGCAGAARVELIAEETGTLYVLEINTLPGMTVTSLLPEAAREAGWSFLDLIRRELDGALRRAGRAGAPAR